MVPHLLIFLLLLPISYLSGIESAATLKLTNRCPQPIWPEILSGANTPDLSPLAPGKSRTIPVPTGWSGRISGRTLCGTSAADCGARKVELSLHGAKPPATVVELVAALTKKVGPAPGVCGAAGCSVEPNPDELKATAAREERGVACNDTSSRTAAHTDYVVVFCPKPNSSGEVVGRRGRAALLLVNKTAMTTTWPSRHPNGALSSAALVDVDFTKAAATSSPADHQESNGGGNEMPMTTIALEPVKMVEMRMMLNDNRRRKLNSFQMCALCTCCSGGSGGSRHYCLLSPCCYAINCNIPNKPFGFCSFTPRTCNCFGCHQ